MAVGRIPVFHLPFPERPEHPQSEKIEAAAYLWARERGLVDEAGHRRLAASRVVTAGTGYFDRGALEDLGVVARWYVWILLADDYYFDDAPVADGRAGWERRVGEFIDDLVTVVEGRSVQGAVGRHGPLFSVVADELWPQTAKNMSTAWRLRFSRHLRATLEAWRWQARVRHGFAPVPSIPEYLTRRRASYTADMFYDMFEMVDSPGLPESFYACRTWYELTSSATDAMAWTNDIFSAPKDLADGERANLVLLIGTQRGCDEGQSIDAVSEMVNERVRHYLYACTDLPYAVRRLGLTEEALASAEELAARLGAAIRANLNCHLRSSRWASDPAAAKTPGI